MIKEYMKQTVEEAARIEREKVILELHDAYRIHKDPKHYVTSSALIPKICRSSFLRLVPNGNPNNLLG